MTYDLYLKVGQKIREVREAQSLSQDELAARLGVTRASVSSLERGKQKIYLHSLLQIADALGLDLKEVMPEPSDSKREFLTARVLNVARMQGDHLDPAALKSVVDAISPRLHAR